MPNRARSFYTTGKLSGHNHSQLRKYNSDRFHNLTPFQVPPITGITAINNNIQQYINSGVETPYKELQS